MKKIALLGIGLALIGLVSYGTLQAYADENEHNFPPIVQKLIEHFSLDEGEVEEVIGEFREEHQARMQEGFEARLTQAVENGELIEEQKQLILAKHEEMRQEHEDNWEEMHNLSPEDRHEAMQEEHDELEAWAEANGVDLKYLHFGKGMRGGHMEGMGGGFGWR